MRPKQPNHALLQGALPLQVWSEAEKQAQRCPLARFRTGAAIWNPASGVVATGTAHKDNQALESVVSVHAEHHALGRAPDVTGSHIAIVALGANASWTHSACPCYSCARMLQSRGVAFVHYALWDGKKWQVKSERPSDLLLRANRPEGRFARKQRIPLPLR